MRVRVAEVKLFLHSKSLYSFHHSILNITKLLFSLYLAHPCKGVAQVGAKKKIPTQIKLKQFFQAIDTFHWIYKFYIP